MQRVQRRKPQRSRTKYFVAFFGVLLLFLASVILFNKTVNAPTLEEKIVNQLLFDDSLSEPEKQTIRDAAAAQSIDIQDTVTVSATTSDTYDGVSHILNVYVPVTSVGSAWQNITTEELASSPIYLPEDLHTKTRDRIVEILGVEENSIQTLLDKELLAGTEIAFIPISELSHSMKLVALNGTYYLDSFTEGAIFRTVSFSGKHTEPFSALQLATTPTDETTLTVNQTGVTALTRVMIRKLNEVGDPLHFSKNIGAFLADADLTHVSNEVSFKDGCTYHASSFCSDPRFIETLKDSGVDLVELTGNHNNDQGSELNTSTINQYHELGWSTFGGGINAAEAAKYHVADIKGTKVAFLGYNYANSPATFAIATADKAGSNPFNFDDIAVDIENAKQEADFVIIDVQYWECYSYPEGGYVEFPECDIPIGEQEANFKQLVDIGADMVVGTQAHQPQTYEQYKGKPIYYGLGNLYFDQTSWPGTERGVVLTHYFYGGKLLQTKLSPTVYGQALQPALMPEAEAEAFLARLQAAR